MGTLTRLIKTKLLVVGLLAVAFCGRAQTANQEYATKHKILATVLGEHYGIPPSVILAVAAVESSCGEGTVARVLNNHFGIVGQNDYVNDKGHKSRYKQYDNVVASYIDFCKMISRKKYYDKLKDNKDPKVWVKAMSKSGYSELPEEWEKKILGMVATHKKN